MSTQTHGFDLTYQIDEDSLLAALDRLLIRNIEMAVSSLGMTIPLNGLEALGAPAIPVNTVQRGRLQITNQPVTTLTMPSAVDGNLTLRIDFPNTLLSLDAVPPLLGLNVFSGLGALSPREAGHLIITLTLSLTSTAGMNRSQIVISRQSIAVDDLSAMPALTGLSPTNGINITAYAVRINSAIEQTITAVLGPLFPVRVDLPFGDRDICNIGVRQLATRLLPAGTGTQASLAFFATLRDSSSGNISQATVSALPSDAEGLFALANSFLLDLVCCLIQRHPTIGGLDGPTQQTPTCCIWRGIDNVSFDGEEVRLEEMRICIEDLGASARFNVFAHASRSGWGWSSHGTVAFNLTIQKSGNGISATPVDIELDSFTEKEWWVWLIEIVVVAIGAGIGFLVGGPGGALAGGAIALAIVAVGDLIISTLMGLAAGTVSGALGTLNATSARLLPESLTTNFGGLSELLEVDFDDLAVTGRVKRPQVRVLHEAWDITLFPGDRLDLDRGVIARVGQPDSAIQLDGDLIWQTDPLAGEVLELAMRSAPSASLEGMAFQPSAGLIVRNPLDPIILRTRSLASLGSARFVKVAGVSYWSLTERDAKAASYPTTAQRIQDTAMPASTAPYPPGHAVMVLRTTAGRYAKCAVWRGSGSELHVGFVTYDTALPFYLRQNWTTTRGPNVPSNSVFLQRYQVSRYGRFDAVNGYPFWVPTFNMPVEWFWNGSHIEGGGLLPDGTTSFIINGTHCELRTQMGTPLVGTLQVRVLPPFTQYVATAQLNYKGTETVPVDAVLSRDLSSQSMTQERPFVESTPLVDQLPAAIARGMRIPPDRVLLR